MRSRLLIAALLVFAYASAHAQPATAPATTRAVRAARAPAPEPGSLPGKGLAQHDFLYCGEWDTRNPMETIFLVKAGKIVWTYEIPDNITNKDGKRDLQEF